LSIILTCREAADLMGVSISTMKYHCQEALRDQRFVCRKLGRRWAIREDSLREFIAKRKEERT